VLKTVDTGSRPRRQARDDWPQGSWRKARSPLECGGLTPLYEAYARSIVPPGQQLQPRRKPWHSNRASHFDSSHTSTAVKFHRAASSRRTPKGGLFLECGGLTPLYEAYARSIVLPGQQLQPRRKPWHSNRAFHFDSPHTSTTVKFHKAASSRRTPKGGLFWECGGLTPLYEAYARSIVLPGQQLQPRRRPWHSNRASHFDSPHASTTVKFHRAASSRRTPKGGLFWECGGLTPLYEAYARSIVLPGQQLQPRRPWHSNRAFHFDSSHTSTAVKFHSAASSRRTPKGASFGMRWLDTAL